MADVHDVAAYILREAGPMSTMKLQKLAYYSQAWNLVWDEQPLFEAPIQAWMNGPVVYELYQQHRGRFTVGDWPMGDPSNLDRNERDTIDAVLRSYDKFSGQQLSALSHKERPWREARQGLPDGASSSAEVSLDSMQAYYSELDMSDSAIEL